MEQDTPYQVTTETLYPAVDIVANEQLQQKIQSNTLAALDQCDWKIFCENGAARRLGLKPTTLASRIKRLGLKP